MKIVGKLVPKPWGQIGVPLARGAGLESEKIGEVIFELPPNRHVPVMVKYLYTSERLSIQVHPDDAQAHDAGLPSGKDEMWIVLAAEPGATIGVGLTHEVAPQELRAAIDDGSIEKLVDWRPVQTGDVIYNAAGTIHAAGAGLTLLEVQQSVDVTYRLYDYGRPRELHLEQGLAVARPGRHVEDMDSRLVAGQSRILVDGPHFGVAWCDGGVPAGLPVKSSDWQIVIVRGEASVSGFTIAEGECALVDSIDDLRLDETSIAMLAWPVSTELAAAA